MVADGQHVVWFEEVTRRNVPRVGERTSRSAKWSQGAEAL